MSDGNASPLADCASEESLVTIPDPERFVDETKITVVPIEPESEKTGMEQIIDNDGKPKMITVRYNAIPTVPIMAIASIVLVVLGALFLSFSAGRINTAAKYGYEPHFGNYVLLAISAFLLTFGICFAFPCLAFIVEKYASPLRLVRAPSL